MGSVRCLWGVVVVFCLASKGAADQAAGIAWPAAQSHADGSYAGGADLATPFQSTAETLQSFFALDEVSGPGTASALDFLAGEPYDGTEYLARRIVAARLFGRNVSPDLEELAERIGATGGFGDQPGYPSTVLDTAFALEARAEAHVGADESADYAVGWLLAAQRSDGGWADGADATSVYLTALALRALWHYRHDYADVPGALDAARTFLLGRRAAGALWDETFESALALIALLPTLDDPAAVHDSLAALAAQQRSDGSWEGDAYVTALALRALALGSLPVTNPDCGRIVGRVIDGQTGLALEGVSVTLGGTAAHSAATGSEGRYAFERLPAGSYTLTLSLTGFATLSTSTHIGFGQSVDLGTVQMLPDAGAATGTVRGTVTAADTGLALKDVTITVTGLQVSARTGAQGTYQIQGVPAGEIQLEASLPGYRTARSAGTLHGGGALYWSPRLPPSHTLAATLEGTITRADTGAALADALVRVRGGVEATVQTELDGFYRLADLPAGEVSLEVRKAGYDVVAGTATLDPGVTLRFSPALTPTASPQTALRGTVSDAETGEPLSAAEVSVTVAHTHTTYTDGSGEYRIDDLSAGPAQVAVSLAGYRTVLAEFQIADGETVRFSPALQAQEGTEPPPTLIRGTVLDARTGAALGGVTVRARFGPQEDVSVSGADGIFERWIRQEWEGSVELELAGYVGVRFGLVIEPGVAVDLGQIRLRPEGVAALLPDLSVASLDLAATVFEPQSGAVRGEVAVLVENDGAVRAAGPTDVLAFRDIDGDAVFTAAGDEVLGHSETGAAVAPGESVRVRVPVSGELPFRDAPIHVWVDSAQGLIESDETNNLLSSAASCVFPPATGIDPVLKWAWSDHRGGSIAHPPLVGRLLDTNGDRRIDARDVPVVLTVKLGTLRAHDGRNGHVYWSAPMDLVDHVMPALGDLDGDGVPEVVALKADRTIVAFNHDGSVRWQSTEAIAVDPFGGGGLTLADLEGDGSAEVLAGSLVLDGENGTLRWSSPYSVLHNTVPIAVDLDLDGELEVQIDGQAFNADGSLRFELSTGRRQIAVANLDEDEYPELVVAAWDRLYVYEHDGTLKWGPVVVPRFRKANAYPTVGDFDGDGLPEIGLATDNRYAVYERDGSLLWWTPIVDYSTGGVGATLFDFDDDARTEVVLSDERHLWVFDGPTGEVLRDIPNRSSTWTEYPVIADVDNDGRAELLELNGGGIRVFEDRNDRWPGTRGIWNQYAYHIDNVEHDGAMPRRETYGWLSHNSYRVNVNLGRGLADLALGRVELIDLGAGVAFAARVGNAGLRSVPAGVVLDLYLGDPQAGGTLLGSAVLEGLAPGAYQEVTIDGLQGLPFAGELHAVVDSAGHLEECREANNRVVIALDQIPIRRQGRIDIGADAPFYVAHQDLSARVTVTNTGSLACGFQARVRVQDAAGGLVADLGAQSLPSLDGGRSAELTFLWNTGATLAGEYRLGARLYDPNGVLLDEQHVALHIESGASPAVSVRTRTDRATYHVTDRVALDSLVENLTANLWVSNPALALELLGPDGATLRSEQIPLGDLPPGSTRQVSTAFEFTNVLPGSYRVRGSVLDLGAAALAQDEWPFQVRQDLARSLTGSVEALYPTRYESEEQVCTSTLVNATPFAIADREVRELVASVDRAQPVGARTSTLDLPARAETTQVHAFSTVGLDPGDYACIVQVRIEGEWHTVAHARFTLLEPPLQIEGAWGLGARGRVLVLLDAGVEDPRGPSGSVPALAEQRAFLEARLAEAGWSYTLARDAETFAAELRSGGYALYALLSEKVKLGGTLQKELREAVFRGEGLVVAGLHDERNGGLDAALGIKFRRHRRRADALVLEHSELHPAGRADLWTERLVLPAEPAGAHVVGHFEGDFPPSDATAPAVSIHDYGAGRSVYLGFDLLAEATYAGADGLLGHLLLATLEYAHPSELPRFAGAVVPLSLGLDNLGIATPGRVVIELPAALEVLDPGAAQPEAGGLVCPFDLAEEDRAILRFWVRLPEGLDPISLEARIETGVGPEWAEHARVPLEILPRPAPTLDDALGLLSALAAQEHGYEKALRYLERAEQALARADPERALRKLVRAADELVKIADPDVFEARQAVDGAIWSVARQLPAPRGNTAQARRTAR
jgi:hypothetical protein